MRRLLVATLALAVTTFLGAIRSRLLLASMLCGGAVLALSLVTASASPMDQARLVVDMGLSTASALGSALAIALTISVIAAEVRGRMAYTVLVRPIPRGVFLLGKYLGLVATTNVAVTLLMVATVIGLKVLDSPIPEAFWPSLGLAWLEMAVVCAVTLLFAASSSPAIAATFAIGAVVTGNFAADMLQLAEYMAARGDLFSPVLLRVGRYILPDIQSLSLRVQAANRLSVPPRFVFDAAVYSALYIGALLVLASGIFSRRKSL